MPKSTRKRLYLSLVFPSLFLLLIWGLEGLKYMAHWDLSWLGVFPRTVKGSIGIITAPLIHGGSEHLLANSTPFFFLTAGLLFFYKPIAPKVLLMIYLLSGLWVWVAGRPVWHIGLSGVVYGLAFFLFFSGIFRKNLRALALSLIIVFFYGGMFWGIFPIKPGTSWESHLFGAIAGILTAFHFRKFAFLIPQKSYEWEQEAELAYSHPMDRAIDRIEPWNYKHLSPPPDGFSYPEE